MKNAWIIAVSAVLIALGVCMVSSCGPTLPPSDLNVGDSGPERVAGGIRFTLYEPKAKRVVIVGEFNSWSTTADPMFDRDGRGVWSIILPLKPGRYEYKFLIDDEKWTADSKNPDRVKDGFGGHNSVVTVAP